MPDQSLTVALLAHPVLQQVHMAGLQLQFVLCDALSRTSYEGPNVTAQQLLALRVFLFCILAFFLQILFSSLFSYLCAMK